MISLVKDYKINLTNTDGVVDSFLVVRVHKSKDAYAVTTHGVNLSHIDERLIQLILLPYTSEWREWYREVSKTSIFNDKSVWVGVGKTNQSLTGIKSVGTAYGYAAWLDRVFSEALELIPTDKLDKNIIDKDEKVEVFDMIKNIQTKPISEVMQ